MGEGWACPGWAPAVCWALLPPADLWLTSHFPQPSLGANVSVLASSTAEVSNGLSLRETLQAVAPREPGDPPLPSVLPGRPHWPRGGPASGGSALPPAAPLPPPQPSPPAPRSPCRDTSLHAPPAWAAPGPQFWPLPCTIHGASQGPGHAVGRAGCSLGPSACSRCPARGAAGTPARDSRASARAAAQSLSNYLSPRGFPNALLQTQSWGPGLLRRSASVPPLDRPLPPSPVLTPPPSLLPHRNRSVPPSRALHAQAHHGTLRPPRLAGNT